MLKTDTYLSNGNMKIKKCSIFSLMSGITCKSGVQCSKYCYAKKAEIQYKAVRDTRTTNFKLSKLNDFSRNMTIKLRNIGNDVVRLHEGGDFYSQGYIKKWFKIINNLPNKTFYCYTKRNDLFTKDVLKNKPSNLKLIYSVDGIVPENYIIGKEEQKLLDIGFDKIAVTHLNRTTCPHQLTGKKCISECKLCITGKSKLIRFKKH